MIILIGNRFGFLIPLFVVFAEWGVQSATDACFGAQCFEKHPWTWALGLFVAALVCWWLGRALRGKQISPENDPKTGKEPVPGSAAYARYSMRQINQEAAFSSPRDSLFFLPMFMWGPMLGVVGMGILLMGLLK